MFSRVKKKILTFHMCGQIPNTSTTATAFVMIEVISLNITSLMCQYCKHTDTTMLLTSGSKEAMLVKNTTGYSHCFHALIIKS